MEIGPVELRVLGSLVEKQRTTPDVYPLTLNALRLACNQSTNRDPVVDLDDAAIRAALDRLTRKRWARLASGQGSRAPKYRHLLSETMELDRAELAILGVLMLRGPQTPGELKGRADRLHHFEDPDAVEATLERLGERGHVRRLERQPGQKEERCVQLLGTEERPGPGTGAAGSSDPDDGGHAPAVEPYGGKDLGRSPPTPNAGAAIGARVTRLEEEVGALREALERLREELGA